MVTAGKTASFLNPLTSLPMYLNLKTNPNLSLKIHLVDGDGLDRSFPEMMKLLRRYADDPKWIACARVRHSIIFDTGLLMDMSVTFFCTTVGADLHLLSEQCFRNGIDILEIVDSKPEGS